MATDTNRGQAVGLGDYPVSGSIVARRRDLDELGHLNNVAICAFYEESRLWFSDRALTQFVTDGNAPPILVIVRLMFDFFSEGFYPGSYDIGVGVSHIGTSSVTWSMAMFDGPRLLGGCDAVHAHRGAEGAEPMPAALRALFEDYRAPSVLRR